ncbi:MAG: DTW domain-containing protein YfiP [Glaciecola sp.]
MSKRALCTQCKYPLKTCVCEEVSLCVNKLKVIILQDKNETKNAKNTVRLLELSLSNIEVIQSDNTEEIRRLALKCEQHPDSYALFFPSANSRAFEQGALVPEGVKPREIINQAKCVTNLIFLDGTWRKAKRLYLSHDWLNKIPSLHFEEKLIGKYRIRKTGIENGLSTLEAVSYVLHKSEELDIQPLKDLMEKMQSFWPHAKGGLPE